VTDTTFQLVNNIFSDQCGVEIWLLDLSNFNLDLLVGHDFDTRTQIFNCLTLTTNQDTWLGGVDVDQQLVWVTFDLNTRDTGTLSQLLNEATDLEIFLQQFAEFSTFRVPASIPVTGDL
jgi:hypothetical protein